MKGAGGAQTADGYMFKTLKMVEIYTGVVCWPNAWVGNHGLLLPGFRKKALLRKLHLTLSVYYLWLKANISSVVEIQKWWVR